MPAKTDAHETRTCRVVVFDSGLGGLSVARALRRLAGRAQQDISLAYVADTAAFPYGDRPEERLRARLVALMGRIVRRLAPDVVVIACNTATVVALAALRSHFDVPFVGTVPAIKPAAHRTQSGVIGVLATPSTVRREYTEMLIHTFAYHHTVIRHGAPNLARLAEAMLMGESVPLKEVQAEIRPAFRQLPDGRRTDVLVLGCTHYPLIRSRIEAAAPWPVTVIDPSEAIARRALEVAATARDVSAKSLPCSAEETGATSSPWDVAVPTEPLSAFVTDAAGQARLAPVFEAEGLGTPRLLPFPVDDGGFCA